MNLFLAGGGDPPESVDIDMAFDEAAGAGPILFLVDAAVPEMMSRDDAVKWLMSGPIYRRRKIIAPKDSSLLRETDLAEIAGIYIMGGNTFKLLDSVRRFGLMPPLRKFIERGRPVLGLSAGAIILGKTIETASVGKEGDINAVGLQEFDGFDYFAGRLIMTHFADTDRNELIDLARKGATQIICIREDAGAIWNGATLTAVGDSPVEIITAQEQILVQPQSGYLIDDPAL